MSGNPEINVTIFIFIFWHPTIKIVLAKNIEEKKKYFLKIHFKEFKAYFI